MIQESLYCDAYHLTLYFFEIHNFNRFYLPAGGFVFCSDHQSLVGEHGPFQLHGWNDEPGHRQIVEDRSQDRFALAHTVRRTAVGRHRKRLAAWWTAA